MNIDRRENANMERRHQFHAEGISALQKFGPFFFFRRRFIPWARVPVRGAQVRARGAGRGEWEDLAFLGERRPRRRQPSHHGVRHRLFGYRTFSGFCGVFYPSVCMWVSFAVRLFSCVLCARFGSRNQRGYPASFIEVFIGEPDVFFFTVCSFSLFFFHS